MKMNKSRCEYRRLDALKREISSPNFILSPSLFVLLALCISHSLFAQMPSQEPPLPLLPVEANTFSQQRFVDGDPDPERFTASLTLPHLTWEGPTEPLTLPLPLLEVPLGATVSLTLIHSTSSPSEEAEETPSLQWSQSLLVAEAPPEPISAGAQSTVTLKAHFAGVGTYHIRRGQERWVGVIMVTPEEVPPRLEGSLWGEISAYTIHLSRARSEADTRRAQPWGWRIHPLTLSAVWRRRAPSSDGSEADGLSLDIRAQALDLSGPIALINSSTLPLALDLPEGLSPIWGGTALPLNPPNAHNLDQITRVAPTVPRGPLHLLAPGEGALFWPSRALLEEALLAFGYVAQGGRSWVPPTRIAQLSYMPNDADFEGDVPPESDSRWVTPSSEANPPIDERTSLPKRVWVYQGSPRTSKWRIGGQRRVLKLDEGGAWLELRNLSPRGHPFSVEGVPHRLRLPDGSLSPLRAVSWVDIRARLRLWIPSYSVGIWSAGALSTPEGAHGLSSRVER